MLGVRARDGGEGGGLARFVHRNLRLDGSPPPRLGHVGLCWSMFASVLDDFMSPGAAPVGDKQHMFDITVCLEIALSNLK